MQVELEALLSENAEISAQCDVLEVHLVTVARNLERRLVLSIARNKAAQREIQQLEAEIEEKQFLIRETKSLFSDLCHCGLDLTSSPHLNYEYYAHLFGGKLPHFPREAHYFDPVVFRIYSTIAYFCNCKNNESFLDKCKELMTTIEHLSDSCAPSKIGDDLKKYEMK
jgi:hypothetical protein